MSQYKGKYRASFVLRQGDRVLMDSGTYVVQRHNTTSIRKGKAYVANHDFVNLVDITTGESRGDASVLERGAAATLGDVTDFPVAVIEVRRGGVLLSPTLDPLDTELERGDLIVRGCGQTYLVAKDGDMWVLIAVNGPSAGQYWASPRPGARLRDIVSPTLWDASGPTRQITGVMGEIKYQR